MQAYGRKKVRHNYKDYHPKRGYANWWEIEMNWINKKAERQKAKHETRLYPTLTELDKIENIKYEFKKLTNKY